jgi:hypothetical protein
VRESDQERIIRLASEREEFVTDVDGFVYFWPNRDFGGHFSSHVLRILADELDRRNEAWSAEIDEYFSKEKKWTIKKY